MLSKMMDRCRKVHISHSPSSPAPGPASTATVTSSAPIFIPHPDRATDARIPAHTALTKQLYDAISQHTDMPLDIINMMMEYAFEAEKSIGNGSVDGTVLDPSYPYYWQHEERRYQNPHIDFTMLSGVICGDTLQYDDWNDELRLMILKGWRMSQIIAFGNVYALGISVVYVHPTDPTQTYATPERYGHGKGPIYGAIRTVYHLEMDEYIDSVSVRYGSWYDGVTLTTNRNQRIQIGTSPGGKHYDITTTRPDAPRPFQGDIQVLGFSLGIGGHIHNLGVYYMRMY